jgi:hypothetical protein
MLIYSRVNFAFSPIYALSRTHLKNFKTASELESTVRYLGIEVDDALEMAEQTEVIGW